MHAALQAKEIVQRRRAHGKGMGTWIMLYWDLERDIPECASKVRGDGEVYEDKSLEVV